MLPSYSPSKAFMIELCVNHKTLPKKPFLSLPDLENEDFLGGVVIKMFGKQTSLVSPWEGLSDK